MLVVLSSAVACGGDPERAAGMSAAEAQGRGRSGTGTPDKPWNEADLNRMALTAEDLDGYEVNRTVHGTAASGRTADPAKCGPIVQTLGQSGSAYAATARVGRLFFSEGDDSGANMTLASHSAGDARRVVQAFREAAERCTAFEDVEVSFDYEAVEVQPDPGYGDESVSVRLTQVVSYPDDKPVRVPFAVVVARKGTTVAMFYTFNAPRGPQGKRPASVPVAIVRAQLEKIGELEASAAPLK
ncbi:hypothetical protein [Streptomyces phaeochromogenes]|uniref:hypothetical protein n=1 Tax=Streptomyces phaeochromogenes TaxID=1923 RepID=UPI003697736C